MPMPLRAYRADDPVVFHGLNEATCTSEANFQPPLDERHRGCFVPYYKVNRLGVQVVTNVRNFHGLIDEVVRALR